ncbi:MAG: phytanoyl-CoA dioxygenase family protein [Acidobacteria bacterium]|nr:phytanoyl-CoA dioxygenase family protein [Acidobacteriota bacterium]
MLASTLQEPFALSAQDAAFYQEHGWVTTPTVLDDAWIDEALAGLDQHWTGHRDRVLPGAGKHFADWMPGDGEGTRNNEYLSLQNRKVSRLAWSPTVGSIAAAAAGTSEIRLFDDQIVNKPGGQTNAVVGWHVDGDYWGTCSSKNMLTAWIPLHDCPEEMGPLVVLDGSHKWSHKVDRSILSFHSADMDLLRRHVEGLGLEFKPVTISLERGQFSLHHCLAIHGSYANRSDRSRVALAVHLQDGANQYQPATKPDGRPVQLYNDMICAKNAAGEPNYSDASVFPTLWNTERERC